MKQSVPDMKKLILHANCQGEMLQIILGRHPGFSRHFDCRLYTNYIREPIPDEALAGCSAFIYQYLGTDWGELASAKLLAKLSSNCLTLCIPSYFLRTFWPLQYNAGEHALRDRLLEDLWQRGLARNEYMYMSTRPSLLDGYDVRTIVENSLAHERIKATHTPIAYMPRLLEDCMRKMAFYTPNHPGEELLLLVANEILARLDLPPMTRAAMPSLEPYYTALQLPVHPGLADLFSLSWLRPDTTFALYGHQVAYAQFAWLYAEYRDSGIASFIDFMGRFYARKLPGA